MQSDFWFRLALGVVFIGTTGLAYCSGVADGYRRARRDFNKALYALNKRDRQ